MSAARVRRLGAGQLTGLALLVALVAGCPPQAGKDGADAGSAEEALPAVEVAPARRGPVEDRLRFEGKLEAPRWVDLPVEVAAVVRRLLVEEGDRVEAGQALAELANPDLLLAREQAQLALQRAELTLSDLQAQEAAQEDLLAQGFVAREAVEVLRRQRRMAELGLREGRSGLRRVELDVSRLTLRSPIRGLVARRVLRSPGERVAPGTLAFSIVDPDELLLRQRLPEVLARRLEPGQAAEVVPLAQDDLHLPATLLRRAPVVDAATGFEEVTLALDPAAARAAGLKPGAFARASVLLERREQALLVDKRALLQDSDVPRLFVVREGKAVELRPRFGLSTEDQIEVLDGLSEGEPVVVLGAQRLRDGAKVRSSGGAPPAAAAPDLGPPGPDVGGAGPDVGGKGPQDGGR